MIQARMPDGNVLQFPADTPDDVVDRAAREYISSLPPQRTGLETAANVAGQFGAGVNRGLANLVGAPFDLVNRGLRAVGVPIPEGSVADAAQRGINAVVGEPPAPQGTMERLARGAGTGLVDAASIALPAAGVARATQAVGQAPSLVNRAATALAAQPVMQATAGMVGGAVGEATDSPLAGTAAAFATPLVAAMAGRAITPIKTQPNLQRQALVQYLESQGVPVTAGQATGNRFLQNIEGQLEQLPFTADAQRGIREAQQRAFTRASLRNAGVNSDVATPDVLNQARQTIGGGIGAIANRNTLDFSPQLHSALLTIENDLPLLPAEAAGPVGAYIQRIRGMAQPGSTPSGVSIPGSSYRKMDSQLGRAIRGTSNTDLRTALGELRDEMRRAMDNSISPQDAADWQELRRQYANLMVSARAASGAGAAAAEGQVSPLALRNAVDQSTGRGYAFGRGDQNQLARAGQSVLRAPPDSGTAGRTAANNLLTLTVPASGGGLLGAAVGGPVGAAIGSGVGLAAPKVAQTLMNSPAGQAYLRNQMVNNPVLTQQLLAALTAQQGGAALTRP